MKFFFFEVLNLHQVSGLTTCSNLKRRSLQKRIRYFEFRNVSNARNMLKIFQRFDLSVLTGLTLCQLSLRCMKRRSDATRIICGAFCKKQLAVIVNLLEMTVLQASNRTLLDQTELLII